MDDAYRQSCLSQLDSLRITKGNDSSRGIKNDHLAMNNENIKVDRNSQGSYLNVALGSRSSSGTLGNQPLLRPSVETPFNQEDQSLMCLSSSPSVLRSSNLTHMARESDL